MSTDVYLVVMAGGSGTRFWPKSTSRKPKQLLAFKSFQSELSSDSKSLLARTLDRFEKWIPKEKRIILTTQTLRDAVIQEKLEAEVFAEPQGRNTAPCIYWVAREIAKRNPKAVMMIMPSDHFIAQTEAFISVVQQAVQWADHSEDLVTLGIRPTRPETGYGYLKIAPTAAKVEAFPKPERVEAFIEKPDLKKATEYLSAGNYLWNGGMFVWRTEVILQAFDRFMPEMKKAWESTEGRIEKAYPLMTATSIDYGVMEKTSNVVTFPLECGWDDLGSWISLESLAQSARPSDRISNTISNGEVVAIDSYGNIIDTPQKLVALLGVKDLVIVEHEDAILIAQKDRAQDIRSVVEAVKKVRPDLV